MHAECEIGHSASFDEMVAFLASCKESVPTDTFDIVSNKSLHNLYEELTEREMTLYRHPVLGVATRRASCTRAMILNPAAGTFLLEVSRTYANGRTIPNFTDLSLDRWSLSETRKLGETPLRCLVRGLEQELEVKPENLNPANISSIDYGTKPQLHQSKAYAGIYSDVAVSYFEVKTFQLDPRFKLSAKRDNGVTINRMWVDYTQPLAEVS